MSCFRKNTADVKTREIIFSIYSTTKKRKAENRGFSTLSWYTSIHSWYGLSQKAIYRTSALFWSPIFLQRQSEVDGADFFLTGQDAQWIIARWSFEVQWIVWFWRIFTTSPSSRKLWWQAKRSSGILIRSKMLFPDQFIPFYEKNLSFAMSACLWRVKSATYCKNGYISTKHCPIPHEEFFEKYIQA